jgi:hypothetical protein
MTSIMAMTSAVMLDRVGENQNLLKRPMTIALAERLRFCRPPSSRWDLRVNAFYKLSVLKGLLDVVVDDGTSLLDVAVASVVGAATLAKTPSQHHPQHITRTWCIPASTGTSRRQDCASSHQM